MIPTVLALILLIAAIAGTFSLIIRALLGVFALGLVLASRHRKLRRSLRAREQAERALRRAERAQSHAERINRAGLAFASAERPGILRAGLAAAVDLARGSAVEASIVTRNVDGNLVVEATSVQRTLPYLPTLDLEPLLGTRRGDPTRDAPLDAPPSAPWIRPRAELARVLAMSRTQGNVLLAPMWARGSLVGLLAVGFEGDLADDEIEAIGTLSALLCSALTRERLHARLVHARSEAHFQSLVHNATDLILVVREDLSIAYQSPSVERILGYPANSLLGQSITTLANVDQTSSLIATLTQAADGECGGVPVLLRSDWLDASGQPRHMEIQITNRLDEPAILGLVLNVTDVTDRLEASEALERSEATLRQVHKLDAMGRLAGGIAHDFNNILGVIMMMASSLRSELAGEADNRETVEELEHAALRGAQLTRQLLTFSRADAPSPEITDVGKVVEGLHKMLRRLIGERVELHHQPAASLPAVYIDRGLLEQALMNLVVNARDALPDGEGTVTIETEARHLDAPRTTAAGEQIPAGSYVVLSVIDDGVGMDAVTLGRIFEPFFTTKPVDKGTGLGLSVVYGIVKQSEGHLEAISHPGRGTTLSIYLPARREISRGTLAAPIAAAPRGRGRLLVVEDDRPLRQAMVRVLRRHGYEVLSAAGGAQAERLFDEWEHRFDLVLTDVVMPGRNGPQLVGRLRQRRADLRVLYISGYSDGMLVSLGRQETLLRKPFRPEELAARVHAMLADKPAHEVRQAL
ncbi:MAG: ATP-binding protein [Myxococcota bacterium]